jgi:hypothetical protein
MTVCWKHTSALDLHKLTVLLCMLPIHRQQRELEVMQMAAEAKVRTRSASKALPKTPAVLPVASPVHTQAASVLSASERQDAAAANAARMLWGVPFPARTYPSAAPQSSSTAQKKALASDHGATSTGSADKPAPATPVPHAAVNRQLNASGISSDNGTAQRLATPTPTGTVVAAPHAGTIKLGAATVAASTAASTSVHSVAQPTVLAQGQHLHQHQQQLQVQQQQTAAHTVDLTLDELSDYTSGNEEFPLLIPASCYGGQQPRVTPVTSSSSSTASSNSAKFSGRYNATVRSDDVVASIKALSLSASSKVRCSIQHLYRRLREGGMFVASSGYGMALSRVSATVVCIRACALLYRAHCTTHDPLTTWTEDCK